MSPRRLLACVAALAVMLLCLSAAWLGGRVLAGWMTPLGLIAPVDLLAAALAGLVGGWIARTGFRWPAAGLVILVGLASAISAALAGDPGLDAPRWLARHALAPVAIAAALAWLMAAVGERLAARTSQR